jgi:integrase/recombinase XerD
MAQMTALRRRMIDDMTVRNLSPAPQQSYVYAVAKFSRFFGCSPDRLGIEEVRAYQLHLAGFGWSWSYINQVSCALRFCFGVTLGRPKAFDRIISAKEPKKLPVVLSGEEIVRFLQAVPGLRNRTALTTAYGAGLRVCEVAALKVGNIDSSRMVIRVEHGKGGKDRYVMLSPQLWRLAKPAAWLFPGRPVRGPFSMPIRGPDCLPVDRPGSPAILVPANGSRCSGQKNRDRINRSSSYRTCAMCRKITRVGWRKAEFAKPGRPA